MVSSYPVSPNPRARAHPNDPDTLILLSGHFGEGDGAIQTFDLTTGTESEPIIADAELEMTFASFAGSGERGIILGNSYDYTSTVISCVDLTSKRHLHSSACSTHLFRSDHLKHINRWDC